MQVMVSVTPLLRLRSGPSAFESRVASLDNQDGRWSQSLLSSLALFEASEKAQDLPDTSIYNN